MTPLRTDVLFGTLIAKGLDVGRVTLVKGTSRDDP